MEKYLIYVEGNPPIEVEETANHRLFPGEYMDDRSGLRYIVVRHMDWGDFERYMHSRFEHSDTAGIFVDMFYDLAQASGIAKYVFDETLSKLMPALEPECIEGLRKDARAIERRLRKDAQRR